MVTSVNFSLPLNPLAVSQYVGVGSTRGRKCHFTLWSRKCFGDHQLLLNTCNDNDYLKIKRRANFYWGFTMYSMLSSSTCII